MKKESEGKWLRIQARMPNNAKVAALSDAAFRLHISVKAWCCDEMTDGKVPAAVPAAMPRAPHGKELAAAIKEIVDVGLWHETPTGWRVHHFLKYNMSRARYAALKAAGKKGGEKSGVTRRRNSEAPASAPASPKQKQVLKHKPKQTPKPRPSTRSAGAEHDYDYDHERSKNTAAKDLTGLTRDAAPSAAAAAGCLMLQAGERARLLLQSKDLEPEWQPALWPEVRAFFGALGAAWGKPVTHGGLADPLVRLVLDALALETTPAALEVAGAHVGAWLAQDGRDGEPRGLGQVSFQVLRRALEDTAEAARVEAEADARIQRAMARSAGGQA